MGGSIGLANKLPKTVTAAEHWHGLQLQRLNEVIFRDFHIIFLTTELGHFGSLMPRTHAKWHNF